jgi:hypothetical protein
MVFAISCSVREVPSTFIIGEVPYFWPGAVELRDTGTGMV